MNKLKTIFFAGAVAQALGVAPITLRMWRERGVCDFGHVIEGGEDNPRSRRRYDIREACMMGVALTLSRFGVDQEQAFRIVSNSEEIKSAIAAVFFDADDVQDCVFCLVDGNGGSEDGAGWNNTLFLGLADWKTNAASAFEATDALTKEAAEVLLSVNVSAIARRVIKALRASDEG
ncbi:MAG: MerR family transcriptional regulator [Rhizobium pusense]|nr:MerR family transcriptional regulator [Agrobacterium pusense]